VSNILLKIQPISQAGDDHLSPGHNHEYDPSPENGLDSEEMSTVESRYYQRYGLAPPSSHVHHHPVQRNKRTPPPSLTTTPAATTITTQENSNREVASQEKERERARAKAKVKRERRRSVRGSVQSVDPRRRRIDGVSEHGVASPSSASAAASSTKPGGAVGEVEFDFDAALVDVTSSVNLNEDAPLLGGKDAEEDGCCSGCVIA
jgi:hypothetical protein